MKKNKIGLSFNKSHIENNEHTTKIEVTCHLPGGSKYNDIITTLKDDAGKSEGTLGSLEFTMKEDVGDVLEKLPAELKGAAD